MQRRRSGPVRFCRRLALRAAGMAGYSAGLLAGLLAGFPGAAAAQDGPLVLARDGYFYVGAKTVTVNGREYITSQMYVEERVPANRTKPYPIIMVHGGTMSGTNFTGTPDGREGWAQYFVRQGYAVYVVDQPGRGRSGYLAHAYGPMRNVDRRNALPRFVAQAKSKLWPQAHLHTQWPGTGEPDDPATMQLASGQLPAIADFTRQQYLNRDALLALLEKIGPSILLVHSQAGAFGWPVADARPDLVKALLAIEPNGPPGRNLDFVGAPDFFKEGALALTFGITSVPITYAPAVSDANELSFVKEDKPDGADLATCWKQTEPARQLPNLRKVPTLVLTGEASYHAPYDHCTVKYLHQAGVKAAFIRLADLGIRGNSHVMMLEKNNKEIVAVIAGWLDKTLAAGN
jgi:pimeloyl-ACP methyl ester carboxylesterase